MQHRCGSGAPSEGRSSEGLPAGTVLTVQLDARDKHWLAHFSRSIKRKSGQSLLRTRRVKTLYDYGWVDRSVQTSAKMRDSRCRACSMDLLIGARESSDRMEHTETWEDATGPLFAQGVRPA